MRVVGFERAPNEASTNSIFGGYEIVFGVSSINFGGRDAYGDSVRMPFCVVIAILAVIKSINHQ